MSRTRTRVNITVNGRSTNESVNGSRTAVESKSNRSSCSAPYVTHKVLFPKCRAVAIGDSRKRCQQIWDPEARDLDHPAQCCSLRILLDAVQKSRRIKLLQRILRCEKSNVAAKDFANCAVVRSFSAIKMTITKLSSLVKFDSCRV